MSKVVPGSELLSSSTFGCKRPRWRQRFLVVGPREASAGFLGQVNPPAMIRKSPLPLVCYRLWAIGHSTSAALNRWHKGYHVVRRQKMLPRDIFRTDRDQEIFVPRFQTGNGGVQSIEQVSDRRLVADFRFLGSM